MLASEGPMKASEGPMTARPLKALTISEGSQDDLCPLGPYNDH